MNCVSSIYKMARKIIPLLKLPIYNYFLTFQCFKVVTLENWSWETTLARYDWTN